MTEGSSYSCIYGYEIHLVPKSSEVIWDRDKTNLELISGFIMFMLLQVTGSVTIVIRIYLIFSVGMLSLVLRPVPK